MPSATGVVMLGEVWVGSSVWMISAMATSWPRMTARDRTSAVTSEPPWRPGSGGRGTVCRASVVARSCSWVTST